MARKIRKQTTDERKPKSCSDAPSPAKGRKVVRPEDVVMEEMDADITGIIITGVRKPKATE